MQIKEIKNEQIYYQKEYNLGKIKEEEWHGIARCKNTFVVSETTNEKYIQYPGFTTDEREIVKEYNRYVYSKLNYYNEFTPPRGNLFSDLSHIVCGFKPGHFYQHLSKYETSWLIGPSSKLLHKLLFDIKIYPYFTNVYKNHDMKFGDIITELEFFIDIFPNVKIIFLGSYNEYSRIVYYFSSREKNIKYRNIWHPAYLLRAYSDLKYNKWKQMFLGE
jgi:hypothetical protein